MDKTHIRVLGKKLRQTYVAPIQHSPFDKEQRRSAMASESENTAYSVHAHSYSIIAVVAGLFAALAIIGVLLFIN